MIQHNNTVTHLEWPESTCFHRHTLHNHTLHIRTPCSRRLRTLCSLSNMYSSSLSRYIYPTHAQKRPLLPASAKPFLLKAPFQTQKRPQALLAVAACISRRRNPCKRRRRDANQVRAMQSSKPPKSSKKRTPKSKVQSPKCPKTPKSRQNADCPCPCLPKKSPTYNVFQQTPSRACSLSR